MNDLAQPIESDPPVGGPGATLRSLREARGLSIDGVAQALKLAPRQVEAIEAEDFAALKGPTFARGFVRNYAKLLQTDPSPLVAQIDQRLAPREVDLMPPSNASGDMPSTAASRGMPRSLAVLAATAFAGLLALMAYDHYTDSVNRSRRQDVSVEPKSAAPPAAVAPPADAGREPGISAPAAAPPTEGAGVVPSPPGAPATELKPAADLVPAQPAPAPSAAPPEPGDGHKLGFRFGRDSWVEVRDGEGKVLLSRTLPAGSSHVVEGRGPFSLIIGNAQFVELTLDGQPVDLVPHTGLTVARVKLP